MIESVKLFLSFVQICQFLDQHISPLTTFTHTFTHTLNCVSRQIHKVIKVISYINVYYNLQKNNHSQTKSITQLGHSPPFSNSHPLTSLQTSLSTRTRFGDWIMF